MSGPQEAFLQGSNTQDSFDEKVAPAVPDAEFNVPSSEQVQQIAAPSQPERLGTMFQPAANERVPSTMSAAGIPLAEAVYPGATMDPLALQQQLLFQQQQQQQQQGGPSYQQLLQQQFLQQQQLQAALVANQQVNPQQIQAMQMMMMMQRNQQLYQQTAAQQQQQQQQQFQHSAALQQYQNYAVPPARNPNEPPPAKRQATNSSEVAKQQAEYIARHHFNQLRTTAGVAQLSQAQKAQLYQSLLARARQQLGLIPMMAPQQSGGGSGGAAVNRSNMRVSVDKRNKSAGDKLFQAEDTTGRDADEVVRRCEEISQALQARLGRGVRLSEGRFSGTDFEGHSSVSQDQMIEACGDTARYLKPYQIVGVNFLMLLYRTQVGGAILADEMGLGKTAQLITYLGTLKALDNDAGPHLVVVPASLLENWQRELRRWCPNLRSVVYYGKHRLVVRKRLNTLREKLRRGESIEDDLSDLQDADVMAEAAATERLLEAEAHHDKNDGDPLGLDEMHESDDEFDVKHANVPENLASVQIPAAEPPAKTWDFNAALGAAPFNVMLTSYTLFERDSPDQRADREFLEGWQWSHLIMDEAHALKNRNAQRTTRLRRVANASRRRIMMTGTPLQNDLAELQNLMHFLLPKVFAVQGFENFSSMIQGDEREVQRLTDRMKQLLGPFVLRRLKTEVAGQLTEKKHATEFIEMTSRQKGMYEDSLESYRNQITNKVPDSVAAEGPEAVEKFLKVFGAKKINHVFTHLRKVAQHPLLVRHHYNDALVEQIATKAVEMNLFSGNVTLRRVTEELMAYSDYSLHAFCYNSGPEFQTYRLNTTHLMHSAKFQFLSTLLPKLKAAGSRPLIFSQWTAVLDVIEWLMDELRLPYVRLDGSTAVDERLATVDRFNTSDDVFAFLLSTRAGGQGLNLTGADTVILHDVDFNPQIDRQAEDRCHRLGQTKPVSVYRLVTKNSVDQDIFDMSQRKLKLDHAVLEGITSGRGAQQKEMAQERQQMGMILHNLFSGKTDYEAMVASAGPNEVDAAQKKAEQKRQQEKQEAVKLKAEEKADGSAVAVAAAVKVEQESAAAVATVVVVDSDTKQEVKKESENEHHLVSAAVVVGGGAAAVAAVNGVAVPVKNEGAAAAAPAAEPQRNQTFKLTMKAAPAPAAAVYEENGNQHKNPQ